MQGRARMPRHRAGCSFGALAPPGALRAEWRDLREGLDGSVPIDLRSRRRGVIGAPTEKSRRTSGRLFSYFARDVTMKPDIHPNYHMIKVVMTNGVEFMTRSTYGEEGATLQLDIDPNTHPAWTGGSQQLVDRGGRLSRFNSRFAGLGIGGKK
jgi:large subunit ribosomal protein L31